MVRQVRRGDDLISSFSQLSSELSTALGNGPGHWSPPPKSATLCAIDSSASEARPAHEREVDARFKISTAQVRRITSFRKQAHHQLHVRHGLTNSHCRATFVNHDSNRSRVAATNTEAGASKQEQMMHSDVNALQCSRHDTPSSNMSYNSL